MQASGSNIRAPRGQRGLSRGRGSSRGATSSSKLQNNPSIPDVLRDTLRNKFNDKYRGRHSRDHGRNPHPNLPKYPYSKKATGTSLLSTNTPSGFENTSKHQHARGENGVNLNGRGHQPRGNTHDRFLNSPTAVENENPLSRSSSPATMNTFTNTQPSPAPVFNPFATAVKPLPNSFANPFISKPSVASSPFAQPPPSKNTTTKSAPSVFGAPSAPASNPFAFGGAQTQTNGSSFGSQSPSTAHVFDPPIPKKSASFGKSDPKVNGLGENTFSPSFFAKQPTTGTFGAPSSGLSSTPSVGVQSSNFAAPSKGIFATFSSSPSLGTQPNSSGLQVMAANVPCFGKDPAQSKINGFAPKSAPTALANPSQDISPRAVSASSTALASKITRLLLNGGIVAPPWPSLNPGDPSEKNTIDAFWQTSKKYRAKVRAALIRAGLLDDPDKPKKLSEAIDFKGTCEEMCPEFEKITRIMEHDVREPEKAIDPNGRLSPYPPKMIKALARSAAGQDAPLPMDVRSPAALRKTLDYLFVNILGREDGRLRAVHGFLWDRTRAIRRDFVFQSSMSPTELGDQIYCLERITRFHVIALHQLSVEGVVAEGFSEQQEVEQLGKSLLSLIHAYEDCRAQGIPCENEAEFRAYYILFNSHNTGILETVQDWGWKFWGESEQIKIAVSLVETLQNTWDTRGPLKPQSATDIALNAYSRFFSIIEDKKVSYTMACFAEIHFNNVRKSALKAIFAAHRSQRPRTKDWTLSKLNNYLRFDSETDIISFAEAYGLHFEDTFGEDYLSFELDSTISDPFPPLPQRHSNSLVERKRGSHSLPEVINNTVFELEVGKGNDIEIEIEPALEADVDDDQGLFVEDRSIGTNPEPSNFQTPVVTADENGDSVETKGTTAPSTLPPPESSSNPGSLFDRISAPKTTPVDIYKQKPTDTPISRSRSKEGPLATSIFDKPKIHSTPSELPPGTNEPPSNPLFLHPQPAAPPPAPTLDPPPPTNSTANSPNELPQTQFDLRPPAVFSPPTETPKLRFFPSNNAATASQHQIGGLPGNQDHPSGPWSGAAQQALQQPPFSASPASTFNFTPQLQSESPKPSLIQPSNPGPPAPPTSSASINQNIGAIKKARLDGFSNWIVLGQGGLIDQFTIFIVEDALRNAGEIFIKEEAARVARETEEVARQETEEIRYLYLAKKFCRKWRVLARQIWLRKKGKLARQARKDFAQSLRASKVVQASNIVEEFRISAANKRNSLESLLNATGVLNGVHDSGEQLRAITLKERPESSRRRQSSKQSSSTLNSSTSTHRRGNSENLLRRSILSDPSYLTGGSRIHLMSNYSARDEVRKQVSGVQTDYFRLKARGITTLPDGTPLANTVLKTTLNPMHSFNGSSKTETPKPSSRHEIPRSTPTYARVFHDDLRTAVGREEDIWNLTPGAKAGDKLVRQSKSKRSLEGNDEELFERAKRVREQLDEGAGWYRKQIDRDSASRSMS